MNFPCSADHEQDWQPYPVDPYSCYMCDRTYIHTYYQSSYAKYALTLVKSAFNVTTVFVTLLYRRRVLCLRRQLLRAHQRGGAVPGQRRRRRVRFPQAGPYADDFHGCEAGEGRIRFASTMATCVFLIRVDGARTCISPCKVLYSPANHIFYRSLEVSSRAGLCDKVSSRKLAPPARLGG